MIAVVTGSRAEWGLLKPLVDIIKPELFVTGSHLAPEFGETWRQIDYPISEKVPCVLSSNTPAGISMSMGLAAIGFGLAYERHRPDLMVVLGDRYEIFAAVAAAHVARIPVAHIHGGEVTEGSYDDGFRHSITKMSHLHFTAAEEYRNRVIQLGERPSTVFNVGALGCDGLVKREYRKPREVELTPKYNCIVAYYGDFIAQAEIQKFVQESHFRAHTIRCSHDVGNNSVEWSGTFSREKYLRWLADADFIIGNSSSGIIEAPALGVPTINIGDRQKGRLMAHSIIHCESPDKLPLALDQLYSDFFQKIMRSDYYMPYKGGNVAEKIADLILKHAGKIEVNKQFYQE